MKREEGRMTMAEVRTPGIHTNDGASRTDERQKGRAMYMDVMQPDADEDEGDAT